MISLEWEDAGINELQTHSTMREYITPELFWGRIRPMLTINTLPVIQVIEDALS